MLSPLAKRNISRIIPFGIIWFIFSLVYSLLEKSILGELHQYPSTGNPYEFSKTLVSTVLTALIIGLLVGCAEILLLNKLFARKSFVLKILFKMAIYLAVIIFFLLLSSIIHNATELKIGFFSKPVWKNVWAFFTNFAFWGVSIYAATVIGVSLFYMEVSENLGQSVLNNFFTGKYHSPVEEERIFMFLDMKSSTTIAEDIGHVKYFQMLATYFSDLTNPIIEYSGEIYQYVGDEIVVSWTLNGGLRDSNCIECFFAMKDTLKMQSPKYKEKFGVMPEFKAGFHLGKVTTGEIGVIKKEIIFTGDVLNTTARIQSLCNDHKVDILISGQLMQRLNLQSQFKITSLGENELKGRDEKIELFTIHR
jgi:class 3 adenylate cyclase